MFIYRWAHKLETDPSTQFKFHRNLTLFWVLTMIVIPFTPPFSFVTHVVDQYSSHTVVDAQKLAALLIMEVSLWANAFTHFGAISSSLAAMHTQPVKPSLQDRIEEVDLFAGYEEAAAEVGLDEEPFYLDDPEPLLNDPDDLPHNLEP